MSMAAQNTTPTPIRIDYPPGGVLRDLPTARGSSPEALDPVVQALFNSIIGQTLPDNPSLAPSPLPYADTTCYRNALLTMLFSMTPFLKFLEFATDRNDDNTSSFYRLQRASRSYWHRPLPTSPSTLASLIQAWAAHVGIARGDQVNGGMATQSWNERIGAGVQADVTEFLHHNFDLIGRTDLQNGDRKKVLDLLFKVQLVSRRAYDCGCQHKVRQVFGHNDTDQWWLSVLAQDVRTSLSTVIANTLYDDNQDFRGNCPSCGALNVRYYQYQKFRHLPEILLVDVNYANHANLSPSNGPLALNILSNAFLPDRIDLASVRDRQPHGGQAGTGQPNGDDLITNEPTEYQLQAVIAYGSLGDQGHYYSIVRRPHNTWITVDEVATPQIQSHNSVKLKQGFAPRVLAYVRVREQSSQQTQQQTSQQTAQQASGIPNSSEQSNRLQNTGQTPATTNTNNSSNPAPPDASNWQSGDFLTYFRNQGISSTNLRQVDKLRTRFNSYHSTDQFGKLRYLLKDELLRRARAAGLDLPSKSTNLFIIAHLTIHMRAQATNRVATSTPAPPPVPPTSRAPPATDPINTSGPSSAPAGPIDTAGSASQPSGAQPVGDTARLQAENDRLRNEVNHLRSQVSQLTQQLQASQSAAATLLQERDTAVQALDQAQADSDSQPAFTPTADDGQSDHAHDWTPSDQGSPLVVRTPLGTRYSSRILRVTTKDIIFADTGDATINSDQRRDHHKYITIPYYSPDRHFITRQWPQIVRYTPTDSSQAGQEHVKFVIHVAVQDQNGSNDSVYRYEIPLGPMGTSMPPLPRLDVDILSDSEAAQLQDEIDDGVTTVRRWTTPPGLVVTPHMTLRVHICAQNDDSGHAQEYKQYSIPLPGHNPDVSSISMISVQMTDAHNAHTHLLHYYADFEPPPNSTARLYSLFREVPRTPQPSDSPQPRSPSSAGSRRQFSEAFGDDGGDGDHDQRPRSRRRTTSSSQHDQILGSPDNAQSTPGDVAPVPTPFQIYEDPPSSPNAGTTGHDQTNTGDGLTNSLFGGNVTSLPPTPRPTSPTSSLPPTTTTHPQSSAGEAAAAPPPPITTTQSSRPALSRFINHDATMSESPPLQLDELDIQSPASDLRVDVERGIPDYSMPRPELAPMQHQRDDDGNGGDGDGGGHRGGNGDGGIWGYLAGL